MTFDVDTIPRERIPALIAALAARLLVEPEPLEPVEPVSNDPDRLLTALEAANLLRRSTKWLSRHRKSLPFARKLAARSWVYSEVALRKWLARQK